MGVRSNGDGGKCFADVGADEIIYERQAQICKAFANPVRLRIIDLVANKPYGVSELQELLQVSKPNLSQHLSVLKATGILSMKRQGKQVFCSLAIPEVRQACHLVRKVLYAQAEDAKRLLV